MSEDIVARLRWRASLGKHTGSELSHDCTEAADEIERLRAALRYYAENHYPNVNDGPWGANSSDFGDVARAALGEKND